MFGRHQAVQRGGSASAWALIGGRAPVMFSPAAHVSLTRCECASGRPGPVVVACLESAGARE